MFTTYRKNSISVEYGKNSFDRYFRSWENAKVLMDKETQDLLKRGFVIVSSSDYMNTSKGFYVYEKRLSDGRDSIVQALVDSYFAD